MYTIFATEFEHRSMKKLPLLILSILLSAGSAFAQRHHIFTFDVMAEQNIGLNKWYGNSSAHRSLHNGVLETLNSTDIVGRVDARLYKNSGLWLALGVGLRGSAKSIPTDLNLFGDLNLNDYTVSDIDRRHKGNATDGVGLRILLGFFTKFYFDKLTLTPSFALGSDAVTSPYLNYHLQSKADNTAYDVSYRWFVSENSGYKPMAHLYLQLKSEYQINPKWGLEFGISYRYFTTRSNFAATVTDAQSGEVVYQLAERGNHRQTIGISAGVSF